MPTTCAPTPIGLGITTKFGDHKIIHAMNRQADNFGRMDVPDDDALAELLLAMPADGAWMCGSGRYSPTLMILLDENSPLVEEDIMPDDCPHPVWTVRLTVIGMAMRAALVAAQVQPLQRPGE